MSAVPPLTAIASLLGIDPDDPVDGADFAVLRDQRADAATLRIVRLDP
ncbi:MAG: hypothetical protein L0K86_21795 [Actinomycetia bacterium]|nr:hypothetical protein [Actinomycetes bacterium]